MTRTNFAIWALVSVLTATTRPSRVLTVSLGAETPQHSVGSSSTKTDQSVFDATRLVDSCACTDTAVSISAQAAIPPLIQEIMIVQPPAAIASVARPIGRVPGPFPVAPRISTR